MPSINDLIPPASLVGFSRELEFPDLSVLDFVLPPTTVENVEYEVLTASGDDVDAAEYRGYDTEAGIGDREGVQRLRGKIPPISRKIRLSEEDTIRLRAEESGNNEPLIEAVFNDARRMNRAVRARVTLAQGQALTTGKVTLSENGVEGEADYGVPGGHIVTAGASWATTSTSIVGDLRTWSNTYATTNNGLRPGGMVITDTILGYMQLNDEFRSLLASLSGAPALITRQSVDQVLQAFGLPPITAVIETQIQVAGSATRVIPADTMFMHPPAGFPLGQTPYGITAEALKLRSGGQIEVEQLSGPIAVVAEIDFDPVATWTKAAAVAIPVLANPKRLFIADTTP